MGILDDLKALNVDPRDPAAVTTALQNLSLSPSGRQALLHEWQLTTGLRLAPELYATLFPQAE
jgi:hypothetical protein